MPENGRTATRCSSNQRSTRFPDIPPRFEINVTGPDKAAKRATDLVFADPLCCHPDRPGDGGCNLVN
jgi:hypothetical protein